MTKRKPPVTDDTPAPRCRVCNLEMSVVRVRDICGRCVLRETPFTKGD